MDPTFTEPNCKEFDMPLQHNLHEQKIDFTMKNTKSGNLN